MPRIGITGHLNLTADGAALVQAALAAGRGGTGDVVRAARERGIPVTVVWPDGTSRG
ncbi:hypothetical protein SAMN05421805_106146 [Saccharopolyspora antimicrobica]|uniref:Uncharacterized protein n=1 Tax=Saccharopolyspora antimicrobica TaxID=455193 RepID=A0A1I5B7Z4_9PSEU|nr:hypothetical protein [Saccharopolyspora antimicrobica]SFN70639.1 hypothetical protein SAMN05421805_106146 [Saccharopolyspora antimicrobica]